MSEAENRGPLSRSLARAQKIKTKSNAAEKAGLSAEQDLQLARMSQPARQGYCQSMNPSSCPPPSAEWQVLRQPCGGGGGVTAQEGSVHKVCECVCGGREAGSPSILHADCRTGSVLCKKPTAAAILRTPEEAFAACCMLSMDEA